MGAVDVKGLRRLVIKIGSSLLIDADGRVNDNWLHSLATDIRDLYRAGHQVLVVSSGAVAIGSNVLGIASRRARLEDLQAAAAAGQVQLVHAYQEALDSFDIAAAQVLLTPDDTEVKRRFQNARNTLEKLLEFGVVPVINENDTVATEELKYGDNDRLAARVAQLVMADGLILLSDVDGLYTANPARDPAAAHIPYVEQVSDDLFEMAGGAVSEVGTGGMITKLMAAKIATLAGCVTIIAEGSAKRPLQRLFDGGRCTVFAGDGTPAAARKQWLAGALETRGELLLDAGASDALRTGGSLLPVGVSDVVGEFSRGDAIALRDDNGLEIGRGLAAYDSDEARLIKGCRSAQIESRLGYRSRTVIVHRDELVLFSVQKKAVQA